MKKITLFIASCIIHAGMYAQTDWHIKGNTGTNSSTNFIGTKDTAAFKIRTNNLVRMTINSSGKVGIGTTDPQDLFHLNGTGNLARFGAGTTSTISNYWITGNGTSGSYIAQVGNSTDPFSDNFRIQTSKSGHGVDYTLFTVDPDNGFSFTAIANGNNNVGIGISLPAYKLHVSAAPPSGRPTAFIENTLGTSLSDGLYIKAGSNTIGGAFLIQFLRADGTQLGSIEQIGANSVQYFTTSDKRLKNIIGTSQKGLADLMKIKIYDYNFKGDPNKKVETGFMAQELYDIFPQAVSKPRDNNEPAEKNPWMVDYGKVTPLIIKAVQELSSQNEKLKNQNEDLQKKYEALQKQIDELKAISVSNQSTVISQLSSASLQQNIPNPFNHTTTINYTLPQTYSSAKIIVVDELGKPIKSINLSGAGKGSINFLAPFRAGASYQYSLYVDGKLVDTKQMVLTK